MKLALISFYSQRKLKEFPTKLSLHAARLATFVKSYRPEFEIEVVAIDDGNWHEEFSEKILKGSFDLVGLPGYNWTLAQSQQLSQLISEDQNCHSICVVGGPEASTFQTIPWNSNTLFIAGQGEHPLLWLCDAVANASDIEFESLLSGCPHAIYSSSCDITKVRARYRIIGRNQSLPVKDGLFSDAFFQTTGSKYQDDYLWYETTRGCIYTCSFCGHNTLPFFATFDDEITENELIEIGKIGISRGFIIDPILGGKPKRGKWLLKKLKEHCPNFKFRAFMRPEFLDEEYLVLLEEANVEELYIGIQTLNPTVPDHVRGNRIDLIKKYLPQLVGRNIRWRAELIMGLPGDNFDGVVDSIKFTIDELQPSTLHVYHFTSIEGTKLDDLVDEISSNEWSIIDPITRKIKASHSFGEREFSMMQVFGTLLANVYMREHAAFPEFKITFDHVEELVKRIVSDHGLEKCIKVARSDVRGLGDLG